MSGPIEPFELAVDDAALDDLRDRLARTRLPDPEPVDDWSQGMPLGVLEELCTYWADGYDWRRLEDELNGLGQFRAHIDGIGIHFLHVRSPHADATPVLMTHGWPGSVVEFLDVIGPLTDPSAHGGDASDAVHLVCPSLPGYGFSDRPTEPGWGVERIAGAWATLMARLGYDRYVAQGGDWGAAVTSRLGHVDPDHVTGVHLNMPLAFPDADALADLTPEEAAALTEAGDHQKWGTGYSTQQSTRPQTVGYGLVDSPAFLCAWIAEKYWAWTDHDGDARQVISPDRMLDNVMLYWLPGTGASAARLYWESFRNIDQGSIEVPVAVSVFPREIFRPSRRWCEARYPDLRRYTMPERGGHFAAFEQPDVFVAELRAALTALA